MVVIRLSRKGSKNRPFYHVVVTDKRKSRDGAFLEKVGYFNPLTESSDLRLSLNQERIQYWVTHGGAQLSDRVKSLVKEARKKLSAVQEG